MARASWDVQVAFIQSKPVTANYFANSNKRDAGYNSTSIREMRFNDGFWLLKHGVKSYYGLQATQVKEKDGAFELLVATRPIRHRGDTLGGARMR
jgi:hypothetical protein